jgi:cell division topological specificity factor
MNWRDLFRARREASDGSAGTAKDRLQIILAHERVSRTGDDFLPKLQKELVAVIARYVPIDPDKVNVSLERGAGLSTLAVEVELPGPQELRRAS